MEKWQKAGVWFSALAELTSSRSSHWDLHRVLGTQQSRPVVSRWGYIENWESRSSRISVMTVEYTLLYSNSIPSHQVTLNTWMLVCSQGSYVSHSLAPSAGKLRLGNDSGWSPPTSSLGHRDMTGTQTVSTACPQSVMVLHTLDLSLCPNAELHNMSTLLAFHPKNSCMAHNKRGCPYVGNISRSHDWGIEIGILENLGCTASIMGK